MSDYKRLSENSEVWKKLNDLCDYAEKLGIMISGDHVQIICGDKEYLLIDAEDRVGYPGHRVSIPLEVEAKIIFKTGS